MNMLHRGFFPGLIVLSLTCWGDAAGADPTDPPLRVTKVADLDFGGFDVGAGPASITITPTGGRSARGTVSLLGSLPGHQASFVVTGQGERSFSIALPQKIVLSEPDVIVDSFTSAPSETGHLQGSSPHASQTVLVGATLHMASRRSSGTYSIPFTLRVEYH
jgi:hypothetical protein